MPEKMTKEEAQISRAIRLVRKAKEVLQKKVEKLYHWK